MAQKGAAELFFAAGVSKKRHSRHAREREKLLGTFSAKPGVLHTPASKPRMRPSARGPRVLPGMGAFATVGSFSWAFGVRKESEFSWALGPAGPGVLWAIQQNPYVKFA